MATPASAATGTNAMPSTSASSPKFPPSHHCAECSRVCGIRDRILRAIDDHLNDHVRKKPTQRKGTAESAPAAGATATTATAVAPVVAPVAVVPPVDAAPTTTKVTDPAVAAEVPPETETNANTPPPVPADAPPPTDTAGDDASIVAPAVPAAVVEIPPAVVVAPFTFLTLPALVELLRPLADVRALLCSACPPDFMSVLASEIKEAVFAYLLSVREDDDAMRAWSRRTISRPLVQVEMLLTAAKVDPVEIKRVFELFELDWAWAYARSRTLPLDRRISAINDIKDVIEFVEKKEEWYRKKGSQGSTAGSMLGYVNAAVSSSLSGPDQPPAYTRIWMNSEALCKFILQNNLLEELLEPSTTHVELIRRCQPLLRLLSMQSAATPGKAGSSSSSSSLLTTAHLDLLWQLSCMGKHESIEHLVYDIVARLSPSLSLPLLNHLWARICERPFAAYDTIYLTLIHSFTLNTLKADSPVAQAAAAAAKGADREQQQTYGIDLLWTLLQSAQISRGDSSSSSPVSPPKTPSPAPVATSASSSVVSPEVLLRARDLLLDLLGLEACAVHRSRFMDRCVLNLKNGVLVAQSLHILLKLIQMYPMKSTGWFGSSSSQTQPAVIEALDEKYDLLNLVLQDMATFQARCNQAEQAKGMQSGSPAHAAADAALSAKLQLEQLEVREEFLVSILTHSSLTLSKAQVDLAWNSLVVQASQSAVRDSCYAWLIDAGDQDSAMMTDEVRAHLFNTKLLTLHPASLTPLGFKLLLRYFLRVHVKAGVMKMSDAESNVANTPTSASQAGKALKGEFGRILAKHRGRPLPTTVASKLAASSSTAMHSKGAPMLERSLSEESSDSEEYALLSDEEQLAASPVVEANVLSSTQRMCSSLSVQQYSEIRGIPLLWDIILRNPRARVARQASVLLNVLHQNLSAKVKNVAAPIGAGNPPTAASTSSTATGDSQSQIRDAHLKACLSHLSKALAETNAPSNGHSRASSAKDLVDVSAKAAADAQSKKKISRCIYVLKTFLNGFADKSARKKITADDTAAQDTFVLHIHPNREYRTEPFDVSMARHATIGDLRSTVFARLSSSNPTVSLKTMCLMWENKKLLTNHFGLGNVGFKSHDHVIIKRNSDLFTAYTPHAMVYSSPSATVFASMLFDCLEESWVEMQGREKYMSAPTLMARTVVNEDADRSWARKKPAAAAAAGEDSSLSSIATDPASFDRLFALLSSNSPIAPSVFEILMMLPSSARGLGSLLDPRTFNPERWESLLDAKAMYRLLYSLQSIEEILSFRTPALVRASPAMQSLDLKNFDLLVWAQGFIAKGGVNYLAALATNKAWQQSHNGGGPPTPLATASKRNGGASAVSSVVVPRAIYHEVLQSLFSILYTFFCFDVTFPGGQQRATRGQTHLAEGCWTRLPNWESWLKLLINEAILPAMLNSQINLSPPATIAGEAGARDDNSTSMILAAMRLLVGCMYAVPALLPSVFYDQETLTPRLLTVLLLECPSSAARTQAAQGFLSIFKLSLRHASNPDQKSFWLRILVQLLRSFALKTHAQQSQEFFLLFSSYIDVLFSPVHAATQAASRDLIHSLSLFPTLWTLLQEHVSTELYENYLQVDEGLFGLLQLMRCLVTNRLIEKDRPVADPSSMAPVSGSAVAASSPSDTTLLSYVYHECLFNTPADDVMQGCKCKTHSTRIQAFALLLELSAAHEACYAELLDMLSTDGMWQIVRPDTQWTYDPTHFEKGLVPAPVGLKNQGATCYMNSFLQVLFSTKVFRHAIMALRTDIDDEADVAHANDSMARASSRSEDSASIVHQLQLLFGHLAWSQKSFFDTLHFCSNFRDYSGLPINIGEQKDVNEFAALLFDQLENEVNQLTKQKSKGGKAGEEHKSSDAASAAVVPNPAIARNVVSQRIIDRTFKGALVHQILALNPDECPHTTAREEAFSMLSLTVVNKCNVDQSLAGFIEGDRLDGENKFMCQGCSKKVAALKRCCLHDTKLPQVLILHFKRFEFNFDSMRKEKVNDHFEFPYKQGEVLNVQKFTQSGIARAEAIVKGLEPPPITPRPEGFYEYTLVAVLIHGGSAEGGHYITICKGEVPSAANAAVASAAAANGAEGGVGPASDSSDQSSFFEFNDSVVRPFNPADIPAACFGGTESVEQFDKTLGRTVMKEVPAIKNAYMAIFERKWKPTEEEAEAEAAANELAAPSATVAPSGEKKPDDAVSSLEDKPQTPQENDNTAATSTDDILLETDEKADGESKPLPASASSSTLPVPAVALPRRSSSSSSLSAVVPSGPIYSFDRSRPDLSHFPRGVLDTVWSDNLAFLHDKFVMDANTNWFLWTLVQLHLPGRNAMMPVSATTPPAPDTSAWASKASVPLAKLSVLFVLKLLVRNADNASFPQWIDLLYQIFDWDAAARDWFLDFLVQGSNMEAPAEKAAENAASSYLSPNAGSALFVQLLFESPIQIVREAMCDLVVFVISAAREDKQERALYFADWKTPAATHAAASHDEAASSSAEPKPVAAEPSKEPVVAAVEAAAAGAEPAPLAVSAESGAAAAAASAMEPRASTPSPAPASSSSALPRLPSSRIIRVFQYLLDWVPRVRKYHRSYKEYWRLMFLLARLGVEERRWFVGAGTIQLILTGFYLDLEPLTGFNVTHPYGTDAPRRKHVPMPFWMLQLLSLLVRSCETDALKGIGPPAPSQTARTLIPLSSTERELLLAGWVHHPPATHPPTRHLLPWLLLDRSNPSAVVGLVVHWCWERVDYSSRLFDLLLRLTVSEITTMADAGEYKLLFAVYTGVLCIADSHSSQTARVEYGLSELLGLLRKVVVRNKIGDQKLLFHAMPMLLQASFKSPVVALWMDTHQRDHAGWLADYKRTRVELAQQLLPQQNYRRT